MRSDSYFFAKMLKEEIKKIIDGDVEDSVKVLDRYSHDYSVFEVRPELVVYPKHIDDIKKLVKFVRDKRSLGFVNISITPRGAGTDMSGGPLNTSIILDMTRYLSGVIGVEKADFGRQKSPTGYDFDISGIARVLPGTFYRDFEKETLKEGLIMPCYPASRELATVGGMVANNGAGEKTLKYGQNKDFVKSLKVILDDGEEYVVEPLTKDELEAKILETNRLAEVYRKVWNLIKRNDDEIEDKKVKTSKNSSGYLLSDVWNKNRELFDPTRLFVGAQGTTGVITEITYKLVKNETNSRLLVIFLKELAHIPELTRELLRHDLETLEIYDDHTFRFAVKFWRGFVKDKGLWGTIRFGLRFLPEFKMMLTGGVPKLIVLAEFVGDSLEGVLQEARVAESKIAGLHLKTLITKTQEERDKYIAIRRDSFKLLSDHSKGERTAPFIDDVIVPIEHLPKYIPELSEILDRNKILYTIAGHLGNGNLHVIPLMDFNDPRTDELIEQISLEVFALVKKYGGSITAEHNDGLIRTPFLSQMFGEKMVAIFKEFKDIMDPENIWNPKKKVGATIADLRNYIIKPKGK